MIQAFACALAKPLPFEHLFVPLASEASEKLHGWISSASWRLLAPEAHADWERYLLTRLANAGAKAAHWQFQVFKTARWLIAPHTAESEAARNHLYHEFVGACPSVRLQILFAEFPTLGGLCAALSENWAATVGEFLARLEADRADFGDRFSVGGFDHPVAKVEAGLSDPHCGGRCVARITSITGDTLIYKPRPLEAEAHFAGLIIHLNAAGIPHPLKAAACWERGEYGWMEDIIPSSCDHLTDVQSFYWRGGALLGLVYLARGVDFHCENLVAASDCPVLIDLETLWHPQELVGNPSTTLSVQSVVRTGFVPQPNPRLGKRYDLSALSAHCQLEHAAAGWKDVNQDNMRWTEAKASFECRHLPSLGGERQAAVSFISDIQAGFQWIGAQLLVGSERGWFEQWLRTLVRCRRRLVLRSTATYQAVVGQLTSPRLLRRDGKLTNGLPNGDQLSAAQHASEIQALSQLDIPYFEQPRVAAEPQSCGPRPPSSEQYERQILKIAEVFTGKPSTL